MLWRHSLIYCCSCLEGDPGSHGEAVDLSKETVLSKAAGPGLKQVSDFQSGFEEGFL